MFLILLCSLQLFQNAHLYPDHDVKIEGRLHITDSLMSQLTKNMQEHKLRSEKSLIDLYREAKEIGNYGDIKDPQYENKALSKKRYKKENERKDKVFIEDDDKSMQRLNKTEPLRRNFLDYLATRKLGTNKNKKIEDNKNFVSKHDEIVSTNNKEVLGDTSGNQGLNTNKLRYFSQNKAQNLIKNDNTRTKEFVDHIVQNGQNKIKTISEYLQTKLGVSENNLVNIRKTALDSYTTKMEDYISYALKQITKTEFDREVSILDIVASCNMLLYSEERKLLSRMIEKKVNNITRYEIDLLTEEVFKQYVNHKKQEIFFACEKLNVCRSYPGFSDYFAELMSELLKLSDSRLTTLVSQTAKIIEKRTKFFNSFMRNDVMSLVGKKLKDISLDLFNVKEIASAVRSIITQRFKVMKTNDENLKIKTNAVRILIDLIDKTFTIASGPDLTAMTFDTVVRAIRRWDTDQDNEIYEPLRLFTEFVVGVVRNSWDEVIQDEVATLTEVIMTGETEAQGLLDELLSKGSSLAKTDDLFERTDLLLI